MLKKSLGIVLFFGFFLSIFSGEAFASAVFSSTDCEVTPAGKARFQSIERAGCGMDLCIDFVLKNGRKGREKLQAKGCGASTCYLTSASFTYTIPHDELGGSIYLGNKSGSAVYLICPNH